MEKDFEQIEEVAAKYFDALYFGNTALFEEIFHPEAKLYSNTGDEFVTMSVPQYLDIVGNRENPGDRGDERSEEILSLSVASPTTAHLRVREVFRPKLFTDELTLVKQQGQWRIVAKVWDYELLAEG